MLGFGKIASGYAEDPRQGAWFRYGTHAQVLAEHPCFDWKAVVDPSAAAREHARERWSVCATAPSIEELECADEIEVAVIATPPESRLGMIERMPSLRAVLVEKPLGTDLLAARRFLDACGRRGIHVAVNLPRRYDQKLQALAAGGLEKEWGAATAVFGVYGNGLLNNGTHLIDLIRMLFGEVADVDMAGGGRRFVEGPISGDCNIPFALSMASGLNVMVQPVVFANYREVSLDIWAERGRVQLLNETLFCQAAPVAGNRQLSGASEIAHEQTVREVMGLSDALYHAYDNLAATLNAGIALACSGAEALVTMAVVESIRARAGIL
ncbi:Gfo/Idh/MocA family protein [Paludibacterium yongneupense]|uniref:Gfo/Idh/MocA family protein n=1 Tax=Paludibacterium yongneupense TaxID=400061 RepID=UPI001C03B3D6|nr:Gfo/Idh/MocA family oxidoreductase [Paludibacterium yongneupense]